MTELNEQQRQVLANHEPSLIDPQTQEVYVLVRRDLYRTMKAQLEGAIDIRETYPLQDEMAAKAGWADPSMDIYDDFAKKP